MSTNVTYFFKYPKSIELAVNDINNVVGCNLTPYEGEDKDLFCMFLSMELSFEENNDYINDRELKYEKYNYNLDIRIPSPDNDLLCVTLQTIATIAYVLYTRLSITQGMLVYDMQTLLALYEENNANNWVNKVNGNVVEFPEHIHDISQIAWQEI